MSFSFRYPQQLLHTNTEPQWLPRPRGEKESSLDRLEREEKYYAEHLKSIVLPMPPDPIGVPSSDETRKFLAHTQTVEAVDLAPGGGGITSPPQESPSFWTLYREEVQALRRPNQEEGTQVDDVGGLLDQDVSMDPPPQEPQPMLPVPPPNSLQMFAALPGQQQTPQSTFRGQVRHAPPSSGRGSDSMDLSISRDSSIMSMSSPTSRTG